MDLGSFHSPVKQEPPKAVIANAVVAAGNPPPSGGGGRQEAYQDVLVFGTAKNVLEVDVVSAIQFLDNGICL